MLLKMPLSSLGLQLVVLRQLAPTPPIPIPIPTPQDTSPLVVPPVESVGVVQFFNSNSHTCSGHPVRPLAPVPELIIDE